MSNDLGAVAAEPKTGSEPIHRGGAALGFTLLDFWRWSSSDLLTNSARGILAEYLVAKAVGHAGETRVEWDLVDSHDDDE